MEKEDPGLIRVIALEDCAFPRKGSHRFERVKTKRQLPYQSGKDREEDSRRVTPCAQINSRSR